MIKRRGYLGLVGTLALAGLGALSGCSSGATSDEPQEQAGVVSELKSSETRVTPALDEGVVAGQDEQAFAFAFLHELQADENLAFSPHSLSSAFAMLTDAAAGQTLDDVVTVLAYRQRDEAFHRSQDALQLALHARNRAAIDRDDQKVDAQILSQSNDVWMREDSPPQASYLDTLARFYGVGVHIADFEKQPEPSRRAINAKVSTDTHQLIPELIPEKAITPSTVLVLTNALYFKAPWQQQLGKPTPGDFHQLDGSVASAQMLKTQQRTSYYAGEGFVATSLPYYGGELEMALIVPDAGKYDDVRSQLSSETLTQIVSQRSSELVEITLPQFSLKSAVAAKKTLEALGMKAPFDPDLAQFPKLASPQFDNVFVSDVLHQATVAIDEKGTEASAATAIILAGTSSANPEPPQPKIVNIDRPFLFVIRDNPTGAVLFVGQVIAP